MKKHILPLTYEPKIKAVLDGVCTQTIRPLNPSNQKRQGDYVMFHGWAGKPYHSKWNWRTPYWLITEVFDVCIKPVGFINPDPEYLFDDSVSNYIAVRDGFNTYHDLYKEFVKMYGDVFDDPFDHKFFQVLRWNPKEAME